MTRIVLTVALLLLSPVCAEYLVGYDSSTGRPLALLGGLLIFAPLYGAPAMLIREYARRRGVRWPGIAALALAFGILQAGVIDQSLFSTAYREIDFWDAMIGPTWIAPLGLAAVPALNFLGGHVVWSFCVPIALVEAACPDLGREPWLRRTGLAVAGLLYLAAAAVVLTDTLRTEHDHAAPGQITGALACVTALVAYACTLGRRRAPVHNGPVPRPRRLLLLAVVAALAVNLAGSTWGGFALAAGALLAAAAGLARLARSARWTVQHVIAAGTGALLARAATGLLATPIGDVPAAAKYAHNVFFLAASGLLGWWLFRRTGRAAAAHPPADPAGAREDGGG
jgi:hypothetical protein